MLNRRMFLEGAACLGAAGLVRKTDAADGAREALGMETMRLGVLSDLHVTRREDTARFERALRKFDGWKVDGVLCCGDLTEFGLKNQLHWVADTWFKVFPDNHAKDGRPVTNLLHYGDHDMATWYADRPLAREFYPNDAERKAALLFPQDNRSRYWAEYFHESFEQIAVKQVKGYTFVLGHYTRGESDNSGGDTVPGLAARLAGLTTDPHKPVFYSQHRIPRGTACDSWAGDDGQTTEVLSRYANIVAFCGHCHMGAAYEKSIWQGSFTCIQVPSLSYCTTMPGRENGYSLFDRPDVVPPCPSKCMDELDSGGRHQGLLCMVHEHGLAVRRWEFEDDAPMGPDWVIPFSTFEMPAESRPFAFANRAKESPVPQFEAGASVDVMAREKGRKRDGSEHLMTPVVFPSALLCPDGTRANDYEVSLILRHEEVERVILQKRVYSPHYQFAAARDNVPVKCLFAEDEVPRGWTLRFEVRPVNAFGRKGDPIHSDWGTYGG